MSELVVDKETGEVLSEAEPVDEPVEPVESEPEPEPEDEPGDEPEPGDEQLRQQENEARAQTDIDVERINTALGREAQRHARRIVEIMGEDSNVLEQCPLCLPFIPGFRYPTPPIGEQLAAVKQAIGEPAEPPLKPDTGSRPCDICDGWGNVATGSKVLGRGKLPCIACKGRGYIAVMDERDTDAVLLTSEQPVTTGYNQPLPDSPDPPEVAQLKALGYIVVAPVPPPQMAA